MNKTRTERRKIRQRRVRSKVQGTSVKPRLSVFKSNTAVYAQIIDDEKKATLAACDSRKIEGEDMTDKAKKVGASVANDLLAKKIDTVVFDRAGYRFTGIVKSLADGAREAGLKF